MSVTEYQEWKEHFIQRGFSVDLANFRAAKICVTNLQPHMKKGAKLDLRDFFPNSQPSKPKSDEEIMAAMANTPGVIREKPNS